MVQQLRDCPSEAREGPGQSFISGCYGEGEKGGLAMLCSYCHRDLKQGITVCPWCGHNNIRTVSILGDSISTFEGYNPTGYSVYYNREQQYKNDLKSVRDTWWSKVIDMLGADMCVNNSYAGCRATGYFPAASSSKRLKVLKTALQIPDIILIFVGYTDFAYGVPIRSDTEPCFYDCYEKILVELRNLYPFARVICGNIMKTTCKDKVNWTFPDSLMDIPLWAYNDTIRKLCVKHQVELADLEATGIQYETLDGSHPTAVGHSQIADAWIRSIRPDYEYEAADFSQMGPLY